MSGDFQDERAWALECLAAGDTIEEIAAWSRRPVTFWRSKLGRLPALAEGRRDILALVDSGLNTLQIAPRVGLSVSRVRAILTTLRAEGLPIPSLDRPRVHPESRVAMVRDMRLHGATYREISGSLGLTMGQTQGIARGAGL